MGDYCGLVVAWQFVGDCVCLWIVGGVWVCLNCGLFVMFSCYE